MTRLSDHQICQKLSAAVTDAVQSTALWTSLLGRRGPTTYHSLQDFRERVPYVDKRVLFDRTRGQMTDGLRGGDLSKVQQVIPSSGTGGDSLGMSFLAREELGALAVRIDRYLDEAFGVSELSTLILSALPGGVSIPSGQHLSIYSGVRPDLALRMLERLGDQYAQIVIVAEPFFAKHLLEYLHARAYPLRRKRIHLVVGGYYLPENLRDYLAWLLGIRPDAADESQRILSTFGMGEVGLNLMAETPQTVALRRYLRDRPLLVARLCGADLPTAPMIFTHDPDRVYIEVENQRLIFTMLELGRLQPVIRYDSGDWGGSIPNWRLRQELPADLLALAPADGSDLFWMYGRHGVVVTDSVYVAVPRVLEALFASARVLHRPEDRREERRPGASWGHGDLDTWTGEDSPSRLLASITGHFRFRRAGKDELPVARYQLRVLLAHTSTKDEPAKKAKEKEAAKTEAGTAKTEAAKTEAGDTKTAATETAKTEASKEETYTFATEPGQHRRYQEARQVAPLPPPRVQEELARLVGRELGYELLAPRVDADAEASPKALRHKPLEIGLESAQPGDHEFFRATSFEEKPRFIDPEPVFRQALTTRDRDRIYRLRHYVFSVEEKLDYGALGADEESRTIRDTADNGATHFVAEIGTKMVGALRVVTDVRQFEDAAEFRFSDWVPPEADSHAPRAELPPAKYGHRFGRDKVALVGRICVTRSERGAGRVITDGLVEKALAWMARAGKDAVFLDCGHEHVGRYVEMGFIEYQDPYIHPRSGRRYHTLIALLDDLRVQRDLVRAGLRAEWDFESEEDPRLQGYFVKTAALDGRLFNETSGEGGLNEEQEAFRKFKSIFIGLPVSESDPDPIDSELPHIRRFVDLLLVAVESKMKSASSAERGRLRSALAYIRYRFTLAESKVKFATLSTRAGWREQILERVQGKHGDAGAKGGASTLLAALLKADEKDVEGSKKDGEGSKKDGEESKDGSEKDGEDTTEGGGASVAQTPATTKSEESPAERILRQIPGAILLSGGHRDGTLPVITDAMGGKSEAPPVTMLVTSSPGPDSPLGGAHVALLQSGSLWIEGLDAQSGDPVWREASRGATLGALAVLGLTRGRLETVVAASLDCTVEVVKKESFEEKLLANPHLSISLARQLIAAYRRGDRDRESALGRLRLDSEPAPGFSQLSEREVSLLCEGLEPQWKAKGTVLHDRGGFADTMWFVRTGTVDLVAHRVEPDLHKPAGQVPRKGYADRRDKKEQVDERRGKPVGAEKVTYDPGGRRAVDHSALLTLGRNDLVGAWSAMLPLRDPALDPSAHPGAADAARPWQNEPRLGGPVSRLVRGVEEGDRRAGPQPHRYGVTARVVDGNALVYEIDRAEFIHRLRTHGELAFAVLKHLAAQILRQADAAEKERKRREDLAREQAGQAVKESS